MLCVADVDVFKIENNFIGPPIASENYSVAIDDTATSSRFANFYGVSDRNLGDELGSAVDLKFVKSREKSATPH
jgi:hypothetical protein